MRLQNISPGEFIDARAHIGTEHFARLKRHEVLPGDVLIAILGDPVPRACLAPRELGPAVVKADCPRLRVDERLGLPAYVMWGLNSPQIRREASARIHGVGRPRLKLKDLKRAEIPVAPLAEQHRIVAEIEKHLTRLDAAVAALERARTNLERYRASVLKAACEGRLLDHVGGKVESWPLREVGELLREKLANGRSVRTRENGFPVLRLTAIKPPYLDITESKGGDWTPENARPFLVHSGDFFVARGSGSLSQVGRGGLVTKTTNIAFPDTMIRLRLDEDLILSEFLAAVWDAPCVRKQVVKKAKTTAGIQKINQGDIASILVPVPPLREQIATVRELGRLLSLQGALSNSLQRATQRTSGLRQSILKHAFEGKLVPQNPDDEPASVLLERIRAERVKNGAKSTSRKRGRRSPVISAAEQSDLH